jgi:hypothetical protein
LTGDLGGNDESISVFPSTASVKRFLNDNSYHVVTLSGTGKRSIKLMGFTMTRGAVTGTDQQTEVPVCTINLAHLKWNCAFSLKTMQIPVVRDCVILMEYANSVIM